MIHYSEQDSAALVKFDIDNTLFHVHDKRHNFLLHLPSRPMRHHPRLPQHSELAPSLLSLPPPLPPLAIPYFSEPIESNVDGHLFRYPGEITPPQVPALRSWGCSSVIHALSQADAHLWLWENLDGSWDNAPSVSSAIMVWTDGMLLALSSSLVRSAAAGTLNSGPLCSVVATCSRSISVVKRFFVSKIPNLSTVLTGNFLKLSMPRLPHPPRELGRQSSTAFSRRRLSLSGQDG